MQPVVGRLVDGGGVMSDEIRRSDVEPVTPHQRYVADGGCPYVEDKVWCNDTVKNHRPGQHWATYIQPNGERVKVWLSGAKAVPMSDEIRRSPVKADHTFYRQPGSQMCVCGVHEREHAADETVRRLAEFRETVEAGVLLGPSALFLLDHIDALTADHAAALGVLEVVMNERDKAETERDALREVLQKGIEYGYINPDDWLGDRVRTLLDNFPSPVDDCHTCGPLRGQSHYEFCSLRESSSPLVEEGQ